MKCSQSPDSLTQLRNIRQLEYSYIYVCCIEIKLGYNFKCSLDTKLQIPELILGVINVFSGRQDMFDSAFHWVVNFLSVETSFVFLAFHLL